MKKLTKEEKMELIKNPPYQVVDGKWLRKKLKESGFTMREFGDMFDSTESTISKHCSESLPMSKIRKSMYFYFFEKIK